MANQNIHYSLLESIRTTFWYDIIKTTYSKQYMGWSAESRTYHNKPIDFADIHEPQIEVNASFLDATFNNMPDEAKQLMDVTEYLDKLQLRNKTQVIPGWTSVSYDYSYSFTKELGRTGEIQVVFTDTETDNDTEMACTERFVQETYTIPCAIYVNYKYYALTPAFIAWCRTLDKPKRIRWLDTLTYQL